MTLPNVTCSLRYVTFDTFWLIFSTFPFDFEAYSAKNRCGWGNKRNAHMSVCAFLMWLVTTSESASAFPPRQPQVGGRGH